MEERRYYNKCEMVTCDFIIKISPIFLGICLGVLIIFSIEEVSSPSISYVYIIRQNNNTDFNFYGLNRTICLASYFKNFPFRLVDVGYEYISPDFGDTYTLQKIKQNIDITVHKLNDYNYGGIKYDFNNDRIIIIAWDYTDIPKLAQSLGCKNCISWNMTPLSNMTDDSLFDITWVLRLSECKRRWFIKCNTLLEFYTISQNLKESVISVQTISKDNAKMDEIIKSYDCDYNSGYNITKW